MSFEDALEKLLSLGIYKCLAERALRTVCKTGRSMDVMVGNENYRINAVYSGEKHEDTKFWGLATSNYTFDVGRV
jgi:hypothetical protein